MEKITVQPLKPLHHNFKEKKKVSEVDTKAEYDKIVNERFETLQTKTFVVKNKHPFLQKFTLLYKFSEEVYKKWCNDKFQYFSGIDPNEKDVTKWPIVFPEQELRTRFSLIMRPIVSVIFNTEEVSSEDIPSFEGVPFLVNDDLNKNYVRKILVKICTEAGLPWRYLTDNSYCCHVPMKLKSLITKETEPSKTSAKEPILLSDEVLDNPQKKETLLSKTLKGDREAPRYHKFQLKPKPNVRYSPTNEGTSSSSVREIPNTVTSSERIPEIVRSDVTQMVKPTI